MTIEQLSPVDAGLMAHRPIQRGSIAELADTLLMARADPGDQKDPYGRAVFWVGAGTSVSAGIPSGRALAGRLAQHIAAKLGKVSTAADCDDHAEHELAFAALQRAGKIGANHTLGTAYGDLFSRLGANDQRKFIRQVIVRTNQRQINWSHLAIGELVRQRVAHTLLTTNFDDLLLDGLVRCDQLPAIMDGVESLNRMDPQPPVPQLVYLHGSQHTYSPRNSTEAVRATHDMPQAQGGLSGLLQHCSVLVVVGYAGNQGEGVMELLQERCRVLPELPIYWVAHGQQDSLSSAAAELLSTARNSRLIPGQDSDLFFRELLREMRIGVPAWFREPVDHLLHLADRIRVEPTPQSSQLSDEINDFRQRLRELLPFWNQVGMENLERRELRQLMLSDDHREVWSRLKDRMLDDPTLLQMRAESAFKLGQAGQGDTLERSVRDWWAVTRRLAPGSPEWALAQDRLGKALATLGECKRHERGVRDAIDAYESALTVHTKDAMPIKWASTRHNQGLALLALMQLRGATSDMQSLHAAKLAFSDALSVYRSDAMPQEWAEANVNLACVLQALGRAGDPSLLEQALAGFDEALKVHTKSQSPAEWAITACHRAVAMMDLGRLVNDERRLRESQDGLQEILLSLSKDAQRHQWAVLRYQQGAVHLALAMRGQRAALREAITELSEAVDLLPACTGEAVDWRCLRGHFDRVLLKFSLGGKDATLAQARDLLELARQRFDAQALADAESPQGDGWADSLSAELLQLVMRESSASAAGSAPEAKGASHGGPDRGSRVLVVEDSEPDQELLKFMLEKCVNNVELCIHASGAAALEDLFQYRPDLLILDLNLPDMQGGEVLACVRAINPSLPVLLYSTDTQAMTQLRERTSPGQRVAILQKGGSLDEFRRLVPTLFRRRQRDLVDRGVAAYTG